jgi:arsenate reductase
MKVLFICTHNRCRSILCEAITNHLAGSWITAKSAGSQPAGIVHPLSLDFLQQKGYPTDHLASESWDLYANFKPDLVITVCDSAAGEACPLYFGESRKLHWGLSDPSKVQGSDEAIASAFLNCIATIESRTQALLSLVKQGTSLDDCVAALQELGAH